MPLRSEREGRADAEVEALERFQRLPERRAARVRPGAAQPFDDHAGIDEALEAPEAELLGRMLGVAQRLGHLRVVLVHQRPILDDAGQAHVVVARHHLRVDERLRVVAPRGLAVLDEQGQHCLGADERHVGDRHGPAHVARGPDERATALVGPGAQHRFDAGLAERLHRRSRVVLEPGAADVGGLGGDPRAVLREPAGDAVGAAATVGVDLVVDAEPPHARLPEALDQRHHLLTVRGADVEDLVEVRLLALGLGAGEIANQDHLAVGVALDHRQGARERGRPDVVREEEDLLALDELDRVLDARRRLVAVVERDDRDRAAVHATALVDLRVVGHGAAVELAPETGRGALERGAHPDPDVVGVDTGRAAARIREAPGGRLTPGPPAQAENTAGRGPGKHLEHRPPLHRHSSSRCASLSARRSRPGSSSGTSRSPSGRNPSAHLAWGCGLDAARVTIPPNASRLTSPSMTSATSNPSASTIKVATLRAPRRAASPRTARASAIGTTSPRRLATPTRCTGASGTVVHSSKIATSRTWATSIANGWPASEKTQARTAAEVSRRLVVIAGTAGRAPGADRP